MPFSFLSVFLALLFHWCWCSFGALVSWFGSLNQQIMMVLCSDYFLLLGWLCFFLLMSYIGSLLAHKNVRTDSRGGLRREWTGPLFHSSDLLDWLSCTGKFLLYLSLWMFLLGNLQSGKVGSERIVEGWIPSSFTAVFTELSYRDDNSEEVLVWGKM